MPATAKSGGAGVFQASHHWNSKWLIVAVAVAGGAGAGLAVATAHPKTASAPPTIPISIGNPSIILGPPK